MSRSVSPSQLHHMLDVAPSVRLTFDSLTRLNSYRGLLYSINIQGKYTYRTRRAGLALDIVRVR